MGMGMKAVCCFGHCMLEIVLKVITIYTRRKSSPMMVSEQLGTLMRLIGPFVWVYLMARVHSGCFREIWIDCAQDGQVRWCDRKVFHLIKTRHVFFSSYFGMSNTWRVIPILKRAPIKVFGCLLFYIHQLRWSMVIFLSGRIFCPSRNGNKVILILRAPHQTLLSEIADVTFIVKEGVQKSQFFYD